VCGRFTVTSSGAQLAAEFDEVAELADQASGRFNVAPTQTVLGLVQGEGRRRAELLRWGLIPHWAKDTRIGFKLINARAESLDERPAYRSLFRNASHRCLVIADGFYEWLVSEDRRSPRVPLHFSLISQRPFAFAGLWTTWKSPDTGEALSSCTVITTTANEVVAPTHDRMPVIFTEPEQYSAWLTGDLDSDDARELLAPLPPELLVARRANSRVNSAKNEGSSLLVPDEEASQPALY
jgi:putative SOS response-associated peptidase YedK